ncbi:MAG: hypothetical protein ICV85_05390 [Tolypothrix sp. T3-bin4]|nr:hypothetical protein [Tolypothrix sp. T3-bin4]
MSNITKTVADKQSARNSASKKSKYQPKYNKPHMIIPIEDMEWALQQSPTVYRLFGECWKSDPYGSRPMPLSTTLRGDNLRKAKKVLKDAGLFDFETRMKVVGNERHYETFVTNYHGARSSYWKLVNQSESPDSLANNPDPRTDNPGSTAEIKTEKKSQPLSASSQQYLSESLNIRTDNPDPRTNNPDPRTDNPGSTVEIKTEKKSQPLSVSSQQHLSNSSKELLRCDENLPQQTAAAPCEGVPPVDGMGDIEDFSEKVERRKKAQSRLKLMGSCGVCDFSFLQECWADLGLRIAIRLELRKRPEWGVTVIDEQLHQFDVDL